uniref:Uncharacterized protein n=1 Tax=Coccidioides posadasii RMSCC 3488 TaxID=454284 RepID=A0A0J6F6C2_COCPO|nr:hypothetical protein CPAG_04813 [Coccidioides posadasii RMSCC 3488]
MSFCCGEGHLAKGAMIGSANYYTYLVFDDNAKGLFGYPGLIFVMCRLP